MNECLGYMKLWPKGRKICDIYLEDGHIYYISRFPFFEEDCAGHVEPLGVGYDEE